jgi:hypothetical protein
LAALRMPTADDHRWRKGLNDENLPSPPSPGKHSLDIPFYRTHDMAIKEW